MEYRPKQFELFYSGLAGTISVRNVKDALFLSKESEDLYFDVIEIAAVEQLKAENERLNKLAEGISAREESIYAEHKLRIEIESENYALKSKLKIAVEALVLLESFGYITQFKYIKQALTEIGGEI